MSPPLLPLFANAEYASSPAPSVVGAPDVELRLIRITDAIYALLIMFKILYV
jgi:hypothetical protein